MIHYLSNDIKIVILIFLSLLLNCSDRNQILKNGDLNPNNKFYQELTGRIDFFVQSKLIKQDKLNVLSRHLTSFKKKATIKDLKTALKSIPKLKRVSPYINGRIRYLLGLKEYREVRSSFYLPITQKETVFAIIEGFEKGIQHAKLLPRRNIKPKSILFSTSAISKGTLQKRKIYKKKTRKSLSYKERALLRKYYKRKYRGHKSRFKKRTYRKPRSRLRAKKVKQSKYLVPSVYSPDRDRM